MIIKKQLAYSAWFTLAGLVMLLAFQPKGTISDYEHYQYRILSETMFMLGMLVWSYKMDILHPVIAYFFLLCCNACFDDWLGNPYDFTFVELSLFIVATIIFYTLIKKRLWKHLKK